MAAHVSLKSAFRRWEKRFCLQVETNKRFAQYGLYLSTIEDPDTRLAETEDDPDWQQTTEEHRPPKMENPVEPTPTIKLEHIPNPVPASSAQVNSLGVALFSLATVRMFVKVSTTPRPLRHWTTLRPPRSRRPVHPGSPPAVPDLEPWSSFLPPSLVRLADQPPPLVTPPLVPCNQPDPSQRLPSPNIAASLSLSPTVPCSQCPNPVFIPCSSPRNPSYPTPLCTSPRSHVSDPR